MKSFYDKEEFNIQDIQELIQNEVEESIYLDFKRAEALEKTDRRRDDISKDVASFANSEGGIIVYGISESNHKASSISYIDGDIFTKEWVEQVINSSIQKRISGLRIFAIRDNGEIKKTIYIVKIPKSLDAPHISRDKRFYKRFNFESVAMEEYEVRQSYGRTVSALLKIAKWGYHKISYDRKTDKFKIIIFCTIVNDGDKMEEQYKVNFYFTHFSLMSFSWDTFRTNLTYHIIGERIKITSVGENPIYPLEGIDAGVFAIEFKSKHLDQLCRDVKIEMRLYYPGSIDEKIDSSFNEINLRNACLGYLKERYFRNIPYPHIDILLKDLNEEKKYFVSLIPTNENDFIRDVKLGNKTKWIAYSFNNELLAEILFNQTDQQIQINLFQGRIENDEIEIIDRINSFLSHFL